MWFKLMSDSNTFVETKRNTGCVLSGPAIALFLLLPLFLFFGGIALNPMMPGNGWNRSRDAAMQQSRQIGQVLLSYSYDNTQNNNAYPDGNSSTEVFQKLIDESYVFDPGIFYVPLPGKIKAIAGQKLKPENVCFDLTAGVAANTSDKLPLVFMTGYKVSYVPGGSAVPLIKPYPPFWTRTWQGWWRGESTSLGTYHEDLSPGVVVCYKDNNVVFLKLPNPEAPGAPIPNFIPPDFKPDGKTYRQLTPNGVLP